MKTRPSRIKLEHPLLDPGKRSRQRLSYTVPVKVDYLLQECGERIGMTPERYIQTAIMDANRLVHLIWDATEDQGPGHIQAAILDVLRAKQAETGKPTGNEADEMTTVPVRVPRAFASQMEAKCEADSITLAEAIGERGRHINGEWHAVS